MQTTATKAFYRSLPLIASALAARYGVKLVFGQQGPATDIRNKIIYYPKTVKSIGGENERILMEGWTDHECAHLRLTDPDAGDASRTPFEFRLRNAIEDIRIERTFPTIYPGTKHTLAAMIALMAKEGNFTPTKGPQESSNVVCMAIVAGLRAKILGQEIHNDAVRWGALLRQIVGPTLKAQIMAIAERGALGDSTWDVLKAAQEIVDLLQQHTAPSEPEQQEGKDDAEDEEQDQGKNQDGNKEAPSEPSEGAEGDQSAEGNANGQPSQSQGDAEANDQETGQTKGKPSKAAGNPGPKENINIQEVLKALASFEASGAEDVSKMLAEELGTDDAGCQVEEEELVPPPNLGPAFQLSPEGSSLVGELARRFDSMLAAKAEMWRRTATSGTRLYRNRLYRANIGHFDVFEKRQQEEGINTAMVLGLDLSFSLSASGQRIVRESGWILSNLLDRHNVPACLMTFDHRICVVKDWHEPARMGGCRLGETLDDGGTAMAALLNQAVRKLLERSEERKVVTIITDGEPNSARAMDVAVSEAKRLGIEVRFVLIGEMTPASFRQKCAQEASGIGQAENFRDVPKAAFTALSEALH